MELAVLAALRSGSFVTLRRMRAYSFLLLIAYAAAVVGLLATAHGIVDAAGRPIGTDFANVYAAGKLALAGEAAQAYDWPAHHEMQKRISGHDDIPYYGWHYPPAFMLVAAVLAALPYLAALLVYQAATLAASLAVVRKIAGRAEAWLLALAFSGVFINVTHGHNGFITAALLGGALLVLDRRPLLAGVLIGCLAYKPQFGLLVPLVLAATGRWRTIATAAATVLVIAGLTWVLFGTEVFIAFWRSLPMTQRVILEGAPGFYKIQSVYAALRQLGVPAGFANAMQMAATLGVAVVLVMLWRSAAAFELKAAALLISCVLATPYALDYDLVVLAPAIAFLAAHGLRQGFAPWELTLLVALWVLPLVARPVAELTAVSLTPVLLLAALGLILRRAGIVQASTGLFEQRALSKPPSAVEASTDRQPY
jgi:alpha-1,2-mannosyltransferase